MRRTLRISVHFPFAVLSYHCSSVRVQVGVDGGCGGCALSHENTFLFSLCCGGRQTMLEQGRVRVAGAAGPTTYSVTHQLVG